jgi:hypothetical protein
MRLSDSMPSTTIVHGPTGGFVQSFGLDYFTEPIDAVTQARFDRWTEEWQRKQLTRSAFIGNSAVK